jgi:small subunit ribosomal protein S27Ae
MAKEKKAVKKGKKIRKGRKHESVKIWKYFEGAKIKKRFCPRCGPGVLLSEHKNRFYCGKCGYTEFKK